MLLATFSRVPKKKKKKKHYNPSSSSNISLSSSFYCELLNYWQGDYWNISVFLCLFLPASPCRHWLSSQADGQNDNQASRDLEVCSGQPPKCKFLRNTVVFSSVFNIARQKLVSKITNKPKHAIKTVTGNRSGRTSETKYISEV